ncbi:MAG TPA: twin-arginine translocase subunit TatC [Bacteroidales bacterium]
MPEQEEKSTKRKLKSSATKEMSFWDHLEELRKRLIRSVFAWVALSILAFTQRDIIFDKIILAPKDGSFITFRWLCQLGDWLNVDSLCMKSMSIHLINYNLSGQFMTHMTISMVVGLILAVPYLFYQIWAFIKPALYEKERRYASKAVFVMSGLFMIGISFAYYFIVPWTLNFLGTYQVSTSVANQISLDSYISTVVSTVFSVGLVFELPVVVFVLAKFGILTPSFLKKNRKYAFVIVLIIAAIITPPDVFSQMIVTLPLWILYEASILVASSVAPKEEEEEESEE